MWNKGTGTTEVMWRSLVPFVVVFKGVLDAACPASVLTALKNDSVWSSNPAKRR